MEQQRIEDVVRNVNERLTRVEHILPTLATKADLAAGIAPLATKAELAAAIAEAVAPLATKVEVREEGVQTRRHVDVVAERLEGQIRLVAEGQVALQERMDARFEDVGTQIAGLDRRVMRLEAGRRR